jgi:outer membrane protein assembly factor BamB
MNLRWTILIAFLVACGLTSHSACAAEPSSDWPFWRGPNFNGVAAEANAPTVWSAEKNVIWKTPVPGRGHSTPIVVGKHIFLATADEEAKEQLVLAFDRASGKELWRKSLHQGGFDGKAHKKNTQATSTLACDGQRLYAVFMNSGAIWVTALDLAGNQVWRKNLGPFTSHWGYSASPTIYKTTLLVAADNKGSGFLASLDLATGDVKWKQERPKAPSYASPVVFHLAGKDQLLLAGCDLMASYDPATGKELWSCEGTTTECVGSVVHSGDLVFASGGYPGKETICVRADGSGEVVWKNNQQVYVPSLLVHQEHLYAVTDSGLAICWHAATGKENWKSRIGGNFSASPVLVGNKIFALSEGGKTTIFKANPEKFELVAENQLGNEAFATPVACGGRLYLRVADNAGGKRQETLYCIGE